MEKMPCLPVKITAKQWADRLQDGYVYMRSLYEFGSWSAIDRSKQETQQIKDSIQGDVREGIVRRVDPQKGDEFFNLLPKDLRSEIKEAYYIEQDMYQYYKVFCMYGLTYFTDQKCFEIPDARIREFGDTAVIIFNPDEFIRRVLLAVSKQYGDNVRFKMDEVRYYPYDYYGELDEFCKHESYAWQNELRMRIALLDENWFIIDEQGRKRKHLIQNIDPITLEIGDIRDISVQISVDDLIALKLPDFIQPPDC